MTLESYIDSIEVISCVILSGVWRAFRDKRSRKPALSGAEEDLHYRSATGAWEE